MADLDIPLVLGEFFYQLRAALDGLLYRAMVITTLDPPENHERLQFPIYSKPKEFRLSAAHFEALSAELRAWIEDVQPYNSEKTASTPFSAINALLALLNDCARKDRHRELHVVAGWAKRYEGQLRFDPPARLSSIEGNECNFLEAEGEFLRIRIEEFDPNVNINLTSGLEVDLSIEGMPGIRGEEIGEVLRSIELAVGFVIHRFEQEIPDVSSTSKSTPHWVTGEKIKIS